jgi:predicted transcriptional regulator
MDVIIYIYIKYFLMTPKVQLQEEGGKKKYQPPKKVNTNHKVFISKVGKKLNSIRTTKDMSPSQLAKESGVSRTLIYKIEEGESYFTISTLLQVLDALDIQAIDFFKDL